MAHLNHWQFSRSLDFWDEGEYLFIVNDSVFKLLNVAFSRVIGVASFRGDNGRNLAWFILMFQSIWCCPWILECIKTEVSDDFVVILRFGQRLRPVFESVGVQWQSLVEVIILYFQLWSEFLPDLFIVFSSPGLEEFRDIDVFGPLLFVLSAFQSLYFDQISHFNFDIIILILQPYLHFQHQLIYSHQSQVNSQNIKDSTE